MKKTILIGILILFTVSCAPLMEETWTVTTPEGPVTVRHYDPARELLMGFYISSLITNPPKTHNDLLLSSYYYPLVVPPYNPLSNYYCPPDIWKAWSPLQRSLWIESARESDLRDYEYKLQSIIDMQMFQMKLDAQSLINDLENKTERAKDELERKKEEAEDAADELEDAAYDAKLKLKSAREKTENAAWWARFRLESAADDARLERLLAEDATPGLPVFSGKEKENKFDITAGLPVFIEKKETPLGGEIGQIIGKSEDQVEVTQFFGPDGLSEKKQFVSVGANYAKRARPFVFLLETSASGDPVLYGTRWPPKQAIDGDAVFWTKYAQSNEKEKEEMRATTRMDKGILVSPSGKRLFEEKEASRMVENGLANAIKEIIDELEED